MSPIDIQVAYVREILILENHNRFQASSLRLKAKAPAFGRVINLAVLRGEMSFLQSEISKSKTTFEFFWQTALYLHGRMSAYEERLESLKKQVKEQEELRAKFEVAARGPALPREIIDNVLDRVPSNNQLVWEGRTPVYVA